MSEVIEKAEKIRLKCWEFFKCRQDQCPGYHSEREKCWLLSHTFCHGEAQGTWLEKMEICIDCPVMRNNIHFEDLDETVSKISQQFGYYKDKIKREQDTLLTMQKKLQNFKTASTYMLKKMDVNQEKMSADRKKLERKVKETSRELNEIEKKYIHSAKMMAMGRFSSGIAHEINNPLGAIINFVRTVLANPGIKGENRGYLELTLKGLFRIENIVKEILVHTGDKKMPFAVTDLNRLVNDCVELVRYRISEQNLTLELNLEDGLPLVSLEPTRMHQVFINILGNAIGALDRGGKLSVTTSSDNGIARIIFLDNGRGIPQAILDKVFDPFFTTKEAGEGSGLGLFICYNIIEMHGGTIDVDSREQEGTRVTVTIPVYQEALEE